MQIIFQPEEMRSLIDLKISTAAIFRHFLPVESKAFLEVFNSAKGQLTEALEALDHVKEDPDRYYDLLEDLQDFIDYQDNFVTIYIDDDLAMVVTFNKKKLCSVIDIVSEEVPAFTGLFFAAYGMMQSLKAISNRIGGRIKAVLAN